MSVILTIITPSDGDIVTSYDTGPHDGFPVMGSHDATEFKQPLVIAMLLKGDGEPENSALKLINFTLKVINFTLKLINFTDYRLHTLLYAH